ncbi:MAG: Omp28-related outer membrane protein [Saprospiraceae bacterium]|nr:Omp28-related outer membrane protein [Candidatus Vicinibacter affinis]
MKTQMIYILKFSFLYISLILFLNSCSDWEQPIQLPNSGGIKSSRVLLVEEFTGASCPNCPSGTAELKGIIDKYPDNIVAVGIHSNFLAAPATVGEVDLRTPEAQAIETFLGAWLGKPEAAFNRKKFNNQNGIRIGKPDTWITFVEQELKEVHEAELKISNKYDSTTRELQITLTATALLTIAKPIYIHALITESEISASQKNQTGILKDYVHEHVLRKLITPVAGELLINSLDVGKSVSKTFTYILPPQDRVWVAEHCATVGFISYAEQEKYVIQAAESKIKR